MFRVIEFPNSFDVLSTDVNGNLPKENTDFWVAHCLILNPQERPSTRCSTFVTLEKILVEFHVSIENVDPHG